MSHSMTRFPRLVYIIRTSGLLSTDWYEQVFERRLVWPHVRPHCRPAWMARAGAAAGSARLGADGDRVAARPVSARVPHLSRGAPTPRRAGAVRGALRGGL